MNSASSAWRSLLAKAQARIPFLKIRPLRTLAGQGQWAELYRRGVAELPELSRLPEGLDLVCQGARQTGQVADLWSRLSDLPIPRSPHVEQVRVQLAEVAEAELACGTKEFLQSGRCQEAAELIRGHWARFGTVPLAAGLELGERLLKTNLKQDRAEILERLCQLYPHDPNVRRLAMLHAVHIQEWDRAWEHYQLQGESPEPQDFHVRLAIIKVLIHNDRMAEAQDRIARECPDGKYPPELLNLVCGLLSEQGQWSRLYQLATEDFSNLLPNAFLLFRILRAARETGQLQDLRQKLLDLPSPRVPNIQRLLDAVVEDLCVAGERRSPDVGGTLISEDRLARIRLRSPALGEDPRPPAEFSILYCCDAAFLRPMVVSLVSLCLSNPLLVQKSTITVLGAPEVFPAIGSLVRILESQLGTTIDVLPAADLVPNPDRLRAEYGVYTGGRCLSAAAYYRIFLAKHLLEQRRYREGLYIDSDTLVRPGLEELLSLPQAKPLMARPELDRSVIRRAVADHRMRGWYFNSGVLRFNFRHDGLAGALGRSIECTFDQSHNLHFNDQCALNIGFDCQVDALPERFNHFLFPQSSPGTSPQGEGVILHYIDQPKPWDSFYPDSARPWFEVLQIVHNLLGKDAARLL